MRLSLLRRLNEEKLNEALFIMILKTKCLINEVIVALHMYHPRGITPAIPSQQYHPRGTIPGVPSQLYHPSYTIPAIPSQLYHPSCTIPAIPSQLYHPSCTTLAIPSQLYHSSYTIPGVPSHGPTQLHWYSHHSVKLLDSNHKIPITINIT